MTHVLSGPPEQGTLVRQRRRLKRSRWKWLLAAPVVMAAGAELFLRMALGFAHPLLYQPDGACGYTVKADQNIVRLRCGNAINHAGMRSPEFSEKRAAGTLRVLLIGDSVTYGTTYVPQGQIFASLLASSLPAVVHEPVEVLNEAVGGWAPGNETKFLTSRGTFDANIVLIVWNTDDLAQPFADFPGGIQFPTQNPWTAIGEVWTRYAEPRLFHIPPPVDPGSVAGDVSPEDAKNAQKNLAYLEEAQAFARKAGAEFGVVLVPSGGAFQNAEHVAMRGDLERWAVDHDAPFFNLTREFSHEDPGAVYFDGIHLRPHGDQVVADGLLARWPGLFPPAAVSAAAGAGTAARN